MKQFNILKFSFFACLLCFFTASKAQSLYTVESFSDKDLIGTARYIGMGGSMGALGADISVMSTNPAGIGLFRRSVVEGSLSFLSQPKGISFEGRDKNNMSFDNIGFVWSNRLEDNDAVPFVNWGFNYHKKKNFNQLLDAEWIHGANGGPSLTYEMADIASFWGLTDALPLAKMGYETYLIEEDPNNKGNYLGYYANNNLYRQARWGSIQQFDFNLSFNLQEQLFLGITLGVHNVNYHNYSVYSESYKNPDTNTSGNGDFVLVNENSISGTGVDVVIGAIFRPIYEKAFRFGVSIASPTFYKLDAMNSAHLWNYQDSQNASINPFDYGVNSSYEYNIETPWRFNLSLANVFANCLAVNLEYEYADYAASKVNYDDGYDRFGSDRTIDDRELNKQLQNYLKAVNTFKVGLEYKPVSAFALRLGYNYQTSSFEDRAYYNPFINSASVDYFDNGAYMNKGSLSRITSGIGYYIGGFNFDLSYMYQNQKADFYSFFADQRGKNELTPRKVDIDRSQITFTIGYKF